MDRLEQLTAEYLDGMLSPVEGQELANCLRADPEGTRQFASLYTQDRLLVEMHRQPDASTIQSIMAEIHAEERAFIGSVMRSIDSERPKPSWRLDFSVFPLRQNWKPLLAIAASVTFVAAVLVWLVGRGPNEFRLAEVLGGQVILKRGGQDIPVSAGMRLEAGDVLRTDTDAVAQVGYSKERTRMELRQSTELQLATVTGSKRFVLRSGELEASVAKQRHGHSLAIVTSQAEARVIGTAFTLSASADTTRLVVTKGQVRLTRQADGAAVTVGAGFSAVVGPVGELLPRPQLGEGTILREQWTNVVGGEHPYVLLFDARYPNHPSSRMYLHSFEAPSNAGENFGARFRGYLHPPVTGEYTFWLAAWEGSELYLSSPDDQPEHKVLIAAAYNKKSRDWDADDVQKSSALTLVGGRRYYIEALQKQGTGTDCLAVAWQGPGRTREVIPGEFLSPFKPEAKENQH